MALVGNLIARGISRSSLLHTDDRAQVCVEFHRARADHFASCHVKVLHKPGVEQNIPSVWNLTRPLVKFSLRPPLVEIDYTYNRLGDSLLVIRSLIHSS